MLRKMLLIRRVEERLLDLFAEGKLNGTTHTCLGQEASAVGVLGRRGPGDIVVSNHRCHGHFLAYGGPLAGLFAEVMGRRGGVCQGIGGSQHLRWLNFYSSGVLGGTAPLAVGMALAERRKGGEAVVICFLGDGAMGEGAVYEALNMASLWALPVLFVVEANGIAQTTPIAQELAGSLRGRFEAFGIPVREVCTRGIAAPVQIGDEAAALLVMARSRRSPGGLIVHTSRLGPHSKGDDLRPKEALELAASHDPLNMSLAALGQQEREALEAHVAAEIDAALNVANGSPVLSPAAFRRVVGLSDA